MAKFLKIYFWQFISVLLNFAALFVVTPYLSSSPSLFGIYSIVAALSIFISYADLGFVTAGIKYASESFAKKDTAEEIQIVGFVGFLFGCFILIYALVVGLMSSKPEMLVTGLTDAREVEIASNLLLILAVASPIFVIQRILQIIFGIRLEDYRFQKVMILSNLLKIISVFVFFKTGSYHIVGYFLWIQVCSALAVIIGICIAKRTLKYDFILLSKSFKFDKIIYRKTNKLAYSSLFLTLCWILFYEIDLFVIGKVFGTSQVAIYAIGLSILTLFRTLFGVLYSPFTPKFNYFIGLNDKPGLRDFFLKVLILGFPIIVFPVLSVSVTIKSFIFNWVGTGYDGTVVIARILVLSYILSFISYPSGALLMAYEKVKWLLFVSASLPIIYWSGIFITYQGSGLLSFAYFKFVALIFSALLYTFMVIRLLKLTTQELLAKIVKPAVISSTVLIGLLIIIKDFLPMEKSKINLLVYTTSIGGCMLGSFFIYYCISKYCRIAINEIARNVKDRLF